MKQGRNLTKLAEELIRQAESKRDFLVDEGRISMFAKMEDMRKFLTLLITALEETNE